MSMPNITKFTDLVRWLVEYATSTEPGGFLYLVQQARDDARTAAESAREASQSANVATEQANIAVEAAQSIINQGLQHATTTSAGIVRLATNTDITNRATDAVTQAYQLQDTRTELASKTQQATRGVTGITRYATAQEISNEVGGVAVTPDMLKYHQFNFNVESFLSSETTLQGFVATRTRYDDVTTVLNLYGRYTASATTFVIDLPAPIDTSKVSVSGTPFTTGSSLLCTDIDDMSLTLSILDSAGTPVAGSALFSIIASLDISSMPQAPTNLSAQSNGSSITLSWTA